MHNTSVSPTSSQHTPIPEPTTPKQDNGWHGATCPTCGKHFVWSTAIKPDVQVQCTGEVAGSRRGTTKRCPQKYLRMEWELIKYYEDKSGAQA